MVKALYYFKGSDDKRKLIPHLKALDGNVKDLFSTQQPWYSLTLNFEEHEFFEIFNFFAQCLRKSGEFNISLDLQNTNLQLYTYKKNHPTPAIINSELCKLYIKLGKFYKAKKHGHQALEISTNALGPSHFNVTDSYNNLGLVYKEMGELQQAKEYQQRALQIRMKALPPGHVDIGDSYNNLSTL